MKTVVLGIGNTLLSDEGIGVHVIQALHQRGVEDAVELVDGGTLSFTLAVTIEEADNLVVVDASELKSDPGVVKTFVGEDMDRFLSGKRSSVHEVGLMDLLTIAQLADRLPANRALVGIQPAVVDWGDYPTDAVAAAIPAACEAVEGLIAGWHA
jgi:hydrogenase maturation protease